MFHLSDRQLNDFVDDELMRGAKLRAERHLKACLWCRLRLTSLRELEDRLRHDAPAPRPELFDRIKASLEDPTPRAPRISEPATLPRRVWFRRTPVWAKAAVAAGVLVVAGVVITPQLSSEAGSLTFTPAKPTASAEVEVEYRSDGRFAGHTQLRLRARYRRRGERPYIIASTTAALLNRQGDTRIFRGTIRLPDSVVYAAFAIEDTAGQIVHSRGHGDWELLVHTSGVPVHQALMQKHQHSFGRMSESSRTAQQAVDLYPDEPESWLRLSAHYTLAGGPALPEDVLARLRLQYQRVGRLLEQPGVSGEDLNAMAFLAMDLFEGDSTESRHWIRRMYEETPFHPKAVQNRVSDVVYGSGVRPTRDVLRDLADLWTIHGTAHPNLAAAGYRHALTLREPGLVMLWAERLLRADLDLSWERKARMAGELIKHPSLRSRAIALLEREIDDLRSSDDAWRPLHRPVEAQQRWEFKQRVVMYGVLGTALFSVGEMTTAMPYLDSAAVNGWDISLFRTVAEAKLRASDVSAAVDMLARVRSDPAISRTLADSVQDLALSLTDRAQWRLALEAAWREMIQRAQAELKNLRYATPVRVLDARGADRNLAEFTTGRVTVVLYAQGVSSLLNQELAAFRRVFDIVEPMGAGGLVVLVDGSRWFDHSAPTQNDLPMVDDAWGEVTRAFDAWRVPNYYVLDADGSIRFAHHDLEAIPRQVAVLQSLEQPS